MKNRFKNILLKIQSTFRLLNVRNIRLFLFSLKNESFKTSIIKVIGVFKRKKSISFGTLYSIKSSNPLPAYYNIDCLTYDLEYILIFGWIYCHNETIQGLDMDNGLEHNSIWIERPELQNTAILSINKSTLPGFLIKFKKLRSSSTHLEINFFSKNHQWNLSLNISSLIQSSGNSYYEHFVRQYARERLSKKPICISKKEPLISIITPTYNTDKHVLYQTIESVLNQTYQHWEWCIYDDGTTSVETLELLEELNKRDNRISVEIGDNIGMVNAYNKAISMAQGEWIVLLDHDDTLSSNALCEIVQVINAKPELSFLYTDEDLINKDGYYEMPSRKGNFSLEKILSHNYINHLMIIRKELGDSINWFNDDFKGAQDYDLILRIIDKISSEKIFYLDQVLYHWRQLESSINFDYSRKAYVLESGRECLQKYYDRNGMKGQVVKAKKLGFYEFISESE